MSRGFSIAYKVVSTIVLVSFACLAICLAGVRLVGLTPYVVTGSSMEPTMHVGSMAYVRACDFDELREGDVITWNMTPDREQATFCTHRIVAIDAADETLATKGDANEREDGKRVKAYQIQGRVAFHLPYLGSLYVRMGTDSGRMASVCFIAIACLLIALPSIARMGEAKAKGKHQI